MEAAAQFRSRQSGILHGHSLQRGMRVSQAICLSIRPISWTSRSASRDGNTRGAPCPDHVYVACVDVAAGTAMYRMARELERFAGKLRAIAAAIYVANPYMIFTAYERTAYAELLAAAWIPLAACRHPAKAGDRAATGNPGGAALADERPRGGDGVLCARRCWRQCGWSRMWREFDGLQEPCAGAGGPRSCRRNVVLGIGLAAFVYCACGV